MSTPNDQWQVMVQGEVYDTDTETLKQWAAEGRILATDKVRKGSLNWNEAGRVPMLRAILNGEAPPPPAYQPAPPPLNHPANYPANYPANPATPTNQSGLLNPTANQPQGQQYQQPYQQQPYDQPYEQQYQQPYAGQSGYPMAGAPEIAPVYNPAMAAPVARCINHPDQSPKYICRVCQTTFCGSCPKFVGNNVAICTACGDLCQVYEEVKEKATRGLMRHQRFGMNDFITAIKYPFNNVIALGFAAVVYGVINMIGTFGFSFATMGCKAMAYLLLFACTSLVIRHVSCGRMNRSFIPDVSEFSYWDDVLVPIFLGIGVSLVVFGPMVLLIVSVMTGMIGPGFSNAMQQSQVASKDDDRLTPDDLRELSEGKDPKRDAEINKKIQRMQPNRDIGGHYSKEELKKMQQEEEQRQQEQLGNLLWQLFAGALPVLLLTLFCVGWALFYYPMAMTIAGFTQDFWSVINPLVGIDTIRRMGGTYFKAFAMYLGAQALGVILMISLSIATAVFLKIPLLGKLFLNIMNGAVAFYIALVVACILGLSLYRSADQLDIAVD